MGETNDYYQEYMCTNYEHKWDHGSMQGTLPVTGLAPTTTASGDYMQGRKVTNMFGLFKRGRKLVMKLFLSLLF